MNNFIDILNIHFKKYPFMQAEDIYKLAYQFYFGPAHFINDKEKAYNFLINEAKECTSKEIEVVDLGECARYSLINDKEYLDKLFNAFYESAKVSEKPLDGFIKILEICINYLKEKEEVYDKFLLLLKRMEELNYPAISHSQIYRDNYNPHYRLVKKDKIKL